MEIKELPIEIQAEINKLSHLFGEAQLEDNPELSGLFIWESSPQGHSFWDNINNGDYREFYKKYPMTNKKWRIRKKDELSGRAECNWASEMNYLFGMELTEDQNKIANALNESDDEDTTIFQTEDCWVICKHHLIELEQDTTFDPNAVYSYKISDVWFHDCKIVHEREKDSYIIFSEQARSKKFGHNGTTSDYKGDGKNFGHWYCQKKDLQPASTQQNDMFKVGDKIQFINNDGSLCSSSVVRISTDHAHHKGDDLYKYRDGIGSYDLPVNEGTIVARNNNYAMVTWNNNDGRTPCVRFELKNLKLINNYTNDVQATIITEHKGSGSSTTGIQYRGSLPTIGLGHLGYQTCTQSSTSKIATSKVRSTV